MGGQGLLPSGEWDWCLVLSFYRGCPMSSPSPHPVFVAISALLSTISRDPSTESLLSGAVSPFPPRFS